MFCEKCGKELADESSFCPYCGEPKKKDMGESKAVLNVKSLAKKLSALSEEEVMEELPVEEYSNVFVEPDEQFMGTLGNGYIENIVHRKVRKCRALLTDKRVYFQGVFFSGNGKKLEQDKCEKIVDVDDITGTGFIYAKPMGIFLKVCFAICAVLVPVFWICLCSEYDEIGAVGMIADVIVALILFIYYRLHCKSYFIIEYAGGAIKFNASIIGIAKVKEFQKQVRRAKDHLKQSR